MNACEISKLSNREGFVINESIQSNYYNGIRLERKLIEGGNFLPGE